MLLALVGLLDAGASDALLMKRRRFGRSLIVGSVCLLEDTRGKVSCEQKMNMVGRQGKMEKKKLWCPLPQYPGGVKRSLVILAILSSPVNLAIVWLSSPVNFAMFG